MQGLRNIVGILFSMAGVQDRPWLAPAFILGLVILFSPLILANQRTDKARRLVKEGGTPAERVARSAEALKLVQDQPTGLQVLADEALKQGRADLVQAVIKRLEEIGRPGDARVLQQRLRGPGPATALEACIQVEKLLGQGMNEEALRRWTEARERWPADEDLLALEAQVREAPPDTV